MKLLFIYSGIAVGVLSAFLFAPTPAAFAATNINASVAQHSAWNDAIGWIDFYSTGNVNVLSSQLQGYASSSVGYISLDCATSPNNNICSSGNGNYKVSNDGAGDLSGWAWNDEIGWISFYWGDASSTYPVTGSTTPACSLYGGYCGVQISPTTGAFSGWAWNDAVGWISFNCSNTSCASSTFDVATTWTSVPTTGTLDSRTFDTGVVGGAQLNSITWQGNATSGTSVSFEVAVSNSSSGPWNFIGPYTSSGITGGTISLGSYTPFNSLIGRYFRYRVILSTNAAQTVSPQVTSVIVNWSP